MAVEKLVTQIIVQGDKKANRQVDKLDKNFASMAKNIIGIAAVAAVATKAIQFMAGSAKLLREDNKQFLKLEAVIKATGNAAGISATQMAEHANAIQDATGVSNTLIMQSQAMIATFKNIGEDIFPRATQAIIDMSAVQGELTGNTLSLSKALNDPIVGITALTRVGVTFTQQQKDQIRVLQESGDIMSAQVIILEELESQFKGTAEASALNTEKMAATFDDLRKTIAAGIEPMIQEIAGSVTEGMGAFTEAFTAELDKMNPEDIAQMTNNFILLGTAVGKMAGGLVTLINLYTKHKDLVDLFMAPATGATGALIKLYEVIASINGLEPEVEDFYEGYGNYLSSIDSSVEATIAGLVLLDDTVKAIDIDFGEAPENQTMDVTDPGDNPETKNLIYNINRQMDLRSEFDDLLWESSLATADREQALLDRQVEQYREAGVAQHEIDLWLANTKKKLDDEGKSRKEAQLITDLKSAALSGQSAMDSMKSVVRAETMEAVAGYLASILKTVPFPFNLIAAAGAGAVVSGVMDKALSAIPSFATGGDFVTNGPQMMLVGDNPGGKERVSITPTSSPNKYGPDNGIRIINRTNFVTVDGELLMSQVDDETFYDGYNRGKIAVGAEF